jgi:diphthamide synthase (EF-2-diphthine--ammonia ligase)
MNEYTKHTLPTRTFYKQELIKEKHIEIKSSSAIEQQIKNLQAKLTKLEDMYLEGRITSERFKQNSRFDRMAEAVGFEPTRPFWGRGLAIRCTRPLCDASLSFLKSRAPIIYYRVSQN